MIAHQVRTSPSSAQPNIVSVVKVSISKTCANDIKHSTLERVLVQDDMGSTYSMRASARARTCQTKHMIEREKERDGGVVRRDEGVGMRRGELKNSKLSPHGCRLERYNMNVKARVHGL
jgi:hypothetical protein